MVDREPLVTIITICYNSEKTIRRTIESVLSQTYRNIEYIIIDGKSIDNSIKIIKEYDIKFEEQNRKYKWISERDKGIADAFNKGLKLATGELVAFLNSDDWYDTDTVKYVINHHNKKNMDYYYGNVFMYENDETQKKLLMGREFSNHVVKYVMPINHPTMFATKRVVLKNGEYSCKYKYAMDYDYVIRMFNNGFEGDYIPNLFVNMQDGGAHQANYYETLKEVNRISVSHGGNKVMAFLLRYYTYFNQKLFGFPVAQWIRKLGLLK